jgi:tRNA 5-methylaminomethyl-2-thiouridine biosynthesis bifunctional protein
MSAALPFRVLKIALNTTADPIIPADVEFIDGGLRSRGFEDDYFMRAQGLAESRQVFIEGNELPRRFSSLKQGQVFVIGETGFGTGLNCLLAADCFESRAPAGACLRLFSTEKHPLDPESLRRAWTELGELVTWSKRLIAAYPPLVPGYQRVVLNERIELVLMFGDAERLLSQAQLRADAWFLDGFAPARNPEMWTAGLFDALARCSRPGATLSSFTAAGQVRRGLADAGFQVERVPGFAAKRHRIDAVRPGHWTAAEHRRGEALIVGAGLAGASAARALAERGWRVRVLDRSGPASGASGNPAGVLYTTPSPHLTPQNRFYQSAFVRAIDWLRRHGFPQRPAQGRLNDVLQYPTSDRHRAKLEAAIDSAAWPPSLLGRHSDDAFVLYGGGYLNPAAWIEHLLDHPCISLEIAEVDEIDAYGRVRLGDGTVLESEELLLCLAHHCAELPGLDWLPLKRIRGQVSFCSPSSQSAAWTQAICHGGYLTPALEGRHCVGATYDLRRPQHGVDPGDDRANLDQLQASLPEHWAALGGERIDVIGQRVAVRCQSLDFLPLAGPLPAPSRAPHGLLDTVHLNIAHGSRGLTHTPLTADLLADQLSRITPSIEPALIDALAPERFVIRKRRRYPDWRTRPLPKSSFS